MSVPQWLTCPRHSSLSVTVCEPTAMSEAGVREASSAGGLLESSCAVGDSSAWLDDAVLDATKYVRKQVCLDTTVIRGYRIYIALKVYRTF